MPYVDRHGRAHTPDDAARYRSRTAVYVVCVRDSKILLVWPDYAPEVAEVPGGGIEDGETHVQAAMREFAEETGLELHLDAGATGAVHHQETRYYALNNAEFWDYDQTYYRLNDDHGVPIFDGFRDTPENGRMAWVVLSDLGDVCLHAIHKPALVALGFLPA